jgi:glutamate carboxypeptidase
MKAGIVQGLYALSQLEERDGVVLLVTGDEETGSVSSRSLIEETAKSCGAVLVLEPGNSNGALVTGRRGSQTFRLTLTGRRAHAAEPHHTDENTLVALAEAILDAGALASTMQGVSITPTMVSAGDAVNVIPEKAELILDVRVSDAGQLERMGALLSSLPHSLSGGSFSVAAVDEARPPLEARHAAALFELACRVARQLELPALEQCDGLGATDGNFTAACGTATLDGLGPVGDGAHRVDEFVELAAMPERAALIRGIVAELLLPRE